MKVWCLCQTIDSQRFPTGSFGMQASVTQISRHTGQPSPVKSMIISAHHLCSGPLKRTKSQLWGCESLIVERDVANVMYPTPFLPLAKWVSLQYLSLRLIPQGCTGLPTSRGACTSMNSSKILWALDANLVVDRVFLNSSQASQNSRFSSLNSVFRKARNAATPSTRGKHWIYGRKKESNFRPV